MIGKAKPKATPTGWNPLTDSSERFSSGIADFDRALGGGFRRGSMALFHVDASVEPSDRALLFTPMLLNFLYQSNGILAVLPARESPHAVRTHLLQWVSRRRFDARVRVVDYVGEDTEAPYVVDLSGTVGPKAAKATEAVRMKSIDKMTRAESAVRGKRSGMFLEMVAFEIMDMLVGPENAARMFFHGIKRTRSVGNLCLGILRPGLGCAEAVRGMADVELSLERTEVGLMVRGIRPTFPSHLVVKDPQRGEPHVTFLPAP